MLFTNILAARQNRNTVGSRPAGRPRGESRHGQAPCKPSGRPLRPRAGAVCVVVLPDQVLVLVAPVTEEGTILKEQGWGFALWDGDAGDGRDLPDIEKLLLDRIKGIRPAGAEAIPVTDWRSDKQCGSGRPLRHIAQVSETARRDAHSGRMAAASRHSCASSGPILALSPTAAAAASRAWA